MSFSRGARFFLLVSWALVVLYPDPGVLVASFRNVAQPRADAGAVAELAAQLPEDPREIEAEVLRRLPYATDWEVGGVPWRFPTAAEAVADGRGDCEARAVVLMSVLAAKGIPYNLRNSFDHMWVDYPGKVPTASENDALVLADREGGILSLRLPEDFDLRREAESKIDLFWTPMPLARRLLLFAGLLLIGLASRRAFAGALPESVRPRGGRPRGLGRHSGVARPEPAGKYSISS
jgi:hypothetical protein